MALDCEIWSGTRSMNFWASPHSWTREIRHALPLRTQTLAENREESTEMILETRDACQWWWGKGVVGMLKETLDHAWDTVAILPKEGKLFNLLSWGNPFIRTISLFIFVYCGVYLLPQVWWPGCQRMVSRKPVPFWCSRSLVYKFMRITDGVIYLFI